MNIGTYVSPRRFSVEVPQPYVKSIKLFLINSYNIQRIEAIKDRQEAAILVFTVVTIICLPLSFMSSLLGMNTYDIRNMNTRQWILWATAIPVTIIIVPLAVFAVLHIDPGRGFWTRIAERDQDLRTVQDKWDDEED